MRRGTTTYRDSSRMFFEISFPLCLFRGGPSNRSLADKRRVNTNDEPWDPLIPSHSPGRIPVFKNVLWLLLRAVLLKRSSSIACFRRSNVASNVVLDTSREKRLVWRSFDQGDSELGCGRTTRDIHMYARVKIKKRYRSISIKSLSSTACEENFSPQGLLSWSCSKKKITEPDAATKLDTFREKFCGTRRIANLENSVCNIVAVVHSAIYEADQCGSWMARIT